MALEALSIIDLDTLRPSSDVIHAKQYDTVRKVQAHLFVSGVKWYVPEHNIYAVVSYKRSAHIGGMYDITSDGELAVSVKTDDRSTIFISLDKSLLDRPGSMRVEVTFYDTISNGRLSCFSFTVEVEETALSTVTIATNPYFSILSEQMRTILQAEDILSRIESAGDITDRLSSIETRLTNLENQ